MIQLLPADEKRRKHVSTDDASEKRKRMNKRNKTLLVVAIVAALMFIAGIVVFRFREELKIPEDPVDRVLDLLVGNDKDQLHNNDLTDQQQGASQNGDTIAVADLHSVIVSTTIARSVDAETGTPSVPVETFDAADTRYNLVLELANVPVGLKAEVQWFKDGQFQADYVLLPDGQYAVFWIDVGNRTPEQRVGKYKAEIRLNDVLIDTVSFQVL